VIQDPNTIAVVKTGVPLGRAGQAQDIANGVLFLAPDASRDIDRKCLAGIIGSHNYLVGMPVNRL
jgi:NAD(P)-dependent dehydrogenase (short-subunit alcohol dehydrogenase family)